ncbi:hypothetical protein [Acinetobacter larvae]|uniref:Lipoprotein n=1 Tax=Acinetobacter larvae TaxID=1789224 RepID=A0A1B2M2V9_9GAMM|nr:hypothetical protein [Acinetobacter larvae]AOA59514.1 hypothetical protein BFG52_14940 [Acinetobacter larvae]
MGKFLSGILLPFILFASGILLLSCTPPPEDTAAHERSSASASVASTPKDSSLLATIQDIARVQLQTSRYISQIKQSQADLQDALAQGDRPAIQNSLAALNQQLTDFKLALNEVNLSTAEATALRQNIIQVTDKLLNNANLKDQSILATQNIEKIQIQLDRIQNDIFKLNTLFEATTTTEDAASSTTAQHSTKTSN